MLPTILQAVDGAVLLLVVLGVALLVAHLVVTSAGYTHPGGHDDD